MVRTPEAYWLRLGSGKPDQLHKARGQYFDPKLNSCVQPSSEREAQALSSYRYLGQVEATTDESIPARITLAHYLAPAEVQVLLDDLRDAYSIVHLNLYFPDVDGGTTIAFEVAGAEDIATAHEEVFQRALERRKTIGATTSEIEEAYAAMNFRVWVLVVRARPAKLRAWWGRHLDVLYEVQPKLNELDKAGIPAPPKDEP